MATKNNAVVPKSDEKPLTKQQVSHHLQVHLSCGVRVRTNDVTGRLAVLQ